MKIRDLLAKIEEVLTADAELEGAEIGIFAEGGGIDPIRLVRVVRDIDGKKSIAVEGYSRHFRAQ